jgi:hypothetical protein
VEKESFLFRLQDAKDRFQTTMDGDRFCFIRQLQPMTLDYTIDDGKPLK